MPRPIHFEIPADRPERAIEFYQKVFGWEFQKWDGPMPYWLVKTGSGTGIDGGLLQRAYPGQGTVNTVDVSSCDEFVRKAESAGGKVAAQQAGLSDPGLFRQWVERFAPAQA